CARSRTGMIIMRGYLEFW
nr:immunoglobulin heavy chain junction region [Macaca mulatta]MOX15583.1 immunoglobulin heavy chain junction region [Macaca mulatta]